MSVSKNNSQEVYSQAIKAGRRTYFFDVKKTLNDDYFVTFTESKKTTTNGKDEFTKHKIFVYKEDFEKILEGLAGAIEFAKSKISDTPQRPNAYFDFEDL